MRPWFPFHSRYSVSGMRMPSSVVASSGRARRPHSSRPAMASRTFAEGVAKAAAARGAVERGAGVMAEVAMAAVEREAAEKAEGLVLAFAFVHNIEGLNSTKVWYKV